MTHTSAVVLIALAATTASAQTCDWEWVNPMPPAGLQSVVYADGRYTALGWGSVASSPDGATWQVQPTAVPSARVIHANGLYVAVGRGIATSPDGVRWTEVWSGGSVTDVEWGNGRFVAVGPELGGDVVTSTDGVTWVQLPTGDSDIARGITWNGSVFLAVGGESPVLRAFESTDGLAWQQVGIVAEDLFLAGSSAVALEWSGSSFLLGAAWELYTSDDGTTWTLRADQPARDFATGGGAIVATSSRACGSWSSCPDILVSWNGGVDWTQAYSPSGYSWWFGGVAWGSAGFVAVGTSGNVFVSPDGASWSCALDACTGECGRQAFSDAAVTGSEVLAVGEIWGSNPFPKQQWNCGGLTALSTDGGSGWSLNHPTEWIGSMWNGGEGPRVAGNGSRYVVVDGGRACTSSGGVSWACNGPFADDVAYGGGRFVAVGFEGRVATSSDGIVWTEHDSGTTVDLGFVEWDGSRFLACGEDGTLLVSEDGADWRLLDSNLAAQLTGLVFDGARYLAVDGERILSSEDARHWSAVHDGRWPHGIDWNGEHFVVAGDGILASADGHHWTSFPVPFYLWTVKWTGDSFIAAGMQRSIVRTTCIGTLAELSPAHLDLAIYDSAALILTLSETVDQAVAVRVASEPAGVVATPATVTVPAGWRTTTIPVTAIGPGAATVTATLPDNLGAGSVTATVNVRQARQVPTLGPSGLAAMVTLLALAAIALLRRTGTA